MSQRFKLLDCTLRDGGYYNNWNFSHALVKDYLTAMRALPVDVVELGFRTPFANRYAGPNLFTTDSYLDRLELPDGPQVAVMINAKEFISGGKADRALIEGAFRPALKSRVQLVRIATHFAEVRASAELVTLLQDMGYRVGLNVMQAGRLTADDMRKAADLFAGKPLEVFYLADSLGNMLPAEVAAMVERLKQHSDHNIGIHTHDNMRRAIDNTLAALDAGATWIDATVTGMGRGPGNARTEDLVIELADRYKVRFDYGPLLSLVEKRFGPMRTEYGWGPHPVYFLSAQKQVHPTFVQEMMADARYTVGEILRAIEFLSTAQGHVYQAESLAAAMASGVPETVGTWNADSFCTGRDLLLVGPGLRDPDLRAAVERFVQEHRPLVASINLHSPIRNDLVDLWVACNTWRLTIDAATLAGKGKGTLVAPMSGLAEDLAGALMNHFEECWDYGVAVKPGTFMADSRQAILPKPLTFAYVMALAKAGGARRVLLAGFEGYTADDPRFQEMSDVIELMRPKLGDMQVIALTPTRYPVSQSSIHYLA